MSNKDPRELTEERLKELRERADALKGLSRISEYDLLECLDYIEFLLPYYKEYMRNEWRIKALTKRDKK